MCYGLRPPVLPVQPTVLATAKVIDVTPTLSVAVSGTAQEAQVLTATPTLGTDSDDSANNVSYQWQRSIDGTNWTYISGATAKTYTAAEGDENGFLRVVASFTDDTAQTVTAVSSATAKVTDVTPGLTVSLSGIPQDGEALTAVPAVISDGDSSASDVTYQWQRSTDNATWNNIGGATSGSYTATDADVGDFVRTVASFSDDTGQSATTNSLGSKINPVIIPPNFQVFDQTTGKTTAEVGTLYTGPVPGLKWQFIKITPDNLNIAALTPNVYIHTGDGNDGINVSSAGGNNTLDGEGGSNFLVGGNGNDTFFVNDLDATTPSWTTIEGFHTGDAATVWGLTPEDFQLLRLVSNDLRRDGVRETGRRGLPAEAVLRCALLKQYRQLSYEELAFHLEDSASFRAFARLPMGWTPKKAVLQKTISAITAGWPKSVPTPSSTAAARSERPSCIAS